MKTINKMIAMVLIDNNDQGFSDTELKLLLIGMGLFLILGIYATLSRVKSGEKKRPLFRRILITLLIVIPSWITVSTFLKAPDDVPGGKLLFMLFLLSISFIVSLISLLQLLLAKISVSGPKTKKGNANSFVFNTHKNRVRVDNVFRGNGVFGGAGSGKSESIIKPFIEQVADKGFTGVLYDFKSPELIDYTRKVYYNAGGDVKINRIDFKDITQSQRVNPVKYVDNAMQATSLAESLMFNLNKQYIKKQDFWAQSIKSVLAGSIWYFKKNHPQMATLPHLFAFFFESSAIELVHILSSDIEVKGQISALKEAIDQKADKQVAGILGTLKTLIGVYNNPQFFWQFSADEANLNVNSPNDPTMLLIGTDSTMAGVYAPLVSSIVTVATQQMNQPNKLNSAIIIDEMPTLFIPNFEQIPATARSNKVAVMIGAQDIAQMVDGYGKEKADVLLANLGNQWFGRTTNLQTAQHVVNLFGKKRVFTNMESQSSKMFSTEVSTTRSKQIEHLENIKVQEVTNFAPGQFASLISEGAQSGLIQQYKTATSFDSPLEKQEFDSLYSPLVMEQIYTDIRNFLELYRTPIDDPRDNSEQKESLGL